MVYSQFINTLFPQSTKFIHSTHHPRSSHGFIISTQHPCERERIEAYRLPIGPLIDSKGLEAYNLVKQFLYYFACSQGRSISIAKHHAVKHSLHNLWKSKYASKLDKIYALNEAVRSSGFRNNLIMLFEIKILKPNPNIKENTETTF